MTKILEIIAGANGSGKSTFWKLIRRLPEYQAVSYLNADTIAEGLGRAGSPIQAGKVMLQEICAYIRSGRSFVFETTLSGQNWRGLLSTARQAGYVVTIHYLFLPNIETAIERVAFRVHNGGHDIPEETIRRRYFRSHKNFILSYQQLSDKWFLYNNERIEATLVAYKSQPTAAPVILDKVRYAEFVNLEYPS